MDLSNISVNDLLSGYDDSETTETLPETEPQSEESTPEEQPEEETTETTEETVEETSEEPASIIAQIQERFGYEFDEEFSDDIDGVVSLALKAGEAKAQQALDEYFAEMPDVAEYLQYRLAGGKPESYFGTNVPDLDAPVAEDQVARQKQILTTHFTRQGYSSEDVADMIADLEDSNLLYKQAAKAQTLIQQQTQAERQKLVEEQKAEDLRRQQEAQKAWTEIQSKVKSGKIGTLTISQTDATSFLDWMNKPIDAEGNTARTLYRQSISQDEALMLEYLAYKKFQVPGLGAPLKETVKNKSLTQMLSKPSSATPSGNQPARRATSLIPSREDLFS